MPEVRSIRRQFPVTVTIPVGDESFTVRFDREAITPWLLDQMSRAIDSGDFLASARMLEAVILEWDLTDEGAPYPPSQENIAKLSMNTLGQISVLIGEASVPSDAEGNASSDTSSTPAMDSGTTPASRLNGQDGSLSPKPSAAPSVT